MRNIFLSERQMLSRGMLLLGMILLLPAAGTIRADFYAHDCSGFIADDGRVYYHRISSRFIGHAAPECGAPRWGFGGDNPWCQLPTEDGPGQNSSPFWLNCRDPYNNPGDGVFYVPPYVQMKMPLWRYPAFQGFFNTALDPQYWEDENTPENLVEVRLQSVPQTDQDWGSLYDQSDGHFRFRVKKTLSNTLANFRYRINWSQTAPDQGNPRIWVNDYFERIFCWDLAVFRPVHRFISSGGTPTEWKLTPVGIPYPVADSSDRSNYQCMYTIPLPTDMGDEFEIEVSSQIPYVLKDIDAFLDSISDKIDAVNAMENWTVTLRTIGYGGLNHNPNQSEHQQNPIRVLEIDSRIAPYCVVIESGTDYEPPGPRVMEGVIEEILDDIIWDGDPKWSKVDFALILTANPDAWVWGSCHLRPYGTKYENGVWVKDPVLEKAGQWAKIEAEQGPYPPPWSYVQDDAEAVALQDYMAGLRSSGSFRCSLPSGLTPGTIPLLKINLHGDICPFPDYGWFDGLDPDKWTRPPGNYGIAAALTFEDLLMLGDVFADRLELNNPYMRSFLEWSRLFSDFDWPHPKWFPGTGFEDIIATVTLEYDEVALYADVTDYGSPTPTPACPWNTSVLTAEGTPKRVWVYATPGNQVRNWEERVYRVSCYHEDNTTYFEDWGADLANAAADFVIAARPPGVPTPTPPAPPTPPLPGSTPLPDRSRYML